MRLADEVGGEALRRTAPRSRTGSGTGRTASRPSRTRRRSPRGRAASRRRRTRSAATTSSMYGRCRSSGTSPAARSRSSAIEPTQKRSVARRSARSARSAAACPSSARARAPSRRCSPASLPKRPCLMCSGCQSIVSFAASIRSRDVGGADVPARLRVVEERRAAAPAVRIGVLVVLARGTAARVPRSASTIVRVGVLHEACPAKSAIALVVGAVGQRPGSAASARTARRGGSRPRRRRSRCARGRCRPRS